MPKIKEQCWYDPVCGGSVLWLDIVLQVSIKYSAETDKSLSSRYRVTGTCVCMPE